MTVATASYAVNVAARAGTLRLTNLLPAAVIREDSSYDIIPWYNTMGAIVLAGEPIIHNGVVCISANPIYAGEVGNVYTKWVADFYIVTAAAEVLMNDLVYWDYGVTGPYTNSGTTKVGSTPTNGFILGRAGLRMPAGVLPALNGSSKPVALAAGTYNSCILRVNSLNFAPTTYGTIGTYA